MLINWVAYYATSPFEDTPMADVVLPRHAAVPNLLRHSVSARPNVLPGAQGNEGHKTENI